ncbi:hypothetical protein EYF80_037015 [Liparis tanakae]|uniref:Uncharacterized protein n=1 Tax=Liparis tanakae TaxID=230148 RepID=A0A4Z2GJ81_9TELE|nr:hypothetical protein EYF80_037015 [Liparis tanakae]
MEHDGVRAQRFSSIPSPLCRSPSDPTAPTLSRSRPPFVRRAECFHLPRRRDHDSPLTHRAPLSVSAGDPSGVDATTSFLRSRPTSPAPAKPGRRGAEAAADI